MRDRIARWAGRNDDAIIMGLALAAGFVFLMWGLSELLGPWAWKVGTGVVLLLVFAGVRPTIALFLDGLYVLSRAKEKKRDGK